MIRLERFEEKDFSQLIEWIDTEILLQHWSGNLFTFPLTNKSMKWYIEDTNEPGISDAFVYKAVDAETGVTVGHISLGGFSYKNRSARINRVLVGNTNHRKAGICRQMIHAVLRIGFEEFKLHRISLGVYDSNIPAIKCYEKSGFKIEGTNRDILKFNNEWWSMIEMSMLENEWAVIKASG
ncbi:MAG: GNAT family protein [Ferruginibacter sp.]